MITNEQGRRLIAHNLRSLLAERSISCRELARRTGDSAVTIAAVARGVQMPGAAVLMRMAEALGTDLDAFFSAPDRKRRATAVRRMS